MKVLTKEDINNISHWLFSNGRDVDVARYNCLFYKDPKELVLSAITLYQNEDGGMWYKGTANAIYQNIEYIDSYNPEYVLILSGDHIYKMDYNKMLDFHKEKKADATIAVIDHLKKQVDSE